MKFLKYWFVPFVIGSCRQTVSPSFLFVIVSCNLILLEVTGLISINPKHLSWTHFPCVIFSKVLISIRTFLQPSRYYVCLVYSIKTSGLMTSQFEIDSLASYSLSHRGRHRRRSSSTCLRLFPIERKLWVFSNWLDDSNREYRLQFYAEHVFYMLFAFRCCDFLHCNRERS